MAAFNKSFSPAAQRGNAMIYVLIVVALFAALAFVLSRNADTAEQGMMDEERVNVMASQIMQVSQQVKQGMDQMLYSGSAIADLEFCLPSDGCYAGGGSHIHKIFHPQGGGMIKPRIPKEAVHQVDTNPSPDWYLGRFNNVEWTDTTETDVLFVAHQIRQDVCARINLLLTGSATIPSLTVDANKVLVDASRHSNGPNVDLDTARCAACEGRAALCVANNAGTIWSFYNVIAQR